MDGHTHKGSNTALPPFLKKKSTLKGNNLLLKEQILSFKSRLRIGGIPSSREAKTGKSQKLFPFLKLSGKHGGVQVNIELPKKKCLFLGVSVLSFLSISSKNINMKISKTENIK